MQEEMRIPDNFLIGVGTSAFQIEGAVFEDGKGESVIDRYFLEHPNWTDDGSDGHIACDSYHKVMEDVALLKDLGVDIYRFSISWSRITPTGDPTKLNRKGITFYHKLIDALLEAEIQPMVTIYHWDHPQGLQDLGGWTNKVMVDFFVDYARILFQEYGCKVKWWCTINEPQLVAENSYGAGMVEGLFTPPRMTHWAGISDYLAQHHMLLAHAHTYRMYQNEFKNAQKGSVGPVFLTFCMKPYSDSPKDKEAARRARLFEIDSMMHPIVKGDYPPEFKQIIEANSKAEGRRISRLPSFTEEEIELIKGSFDFIGINYYSTFEVKFSDSFSSLSQRSDYAGVKLVNPETYRPGVPWLSHQPKDFRIALNYLKDVYGDLRYFITENGCDDPNGLNDTDRINYLKTHLRELMLAIKEDGCRIVGYTIWSFLDNFEWRCGYIPKFGLYQVDFNDPDRPRTPKKSCEFLKQLTKTRVIDELL